MPPSIRRYLDADMRALLEERRGKDPLAGRTSTNADREGDGGANSPFGGSAKIAGLSFSPAKALKNIKQVAKTPMLSKIGNRKMNHTRDDYIAAFDKQANEAAVAEQEYAANRSDQRAILMSLFDNASAQESKDGKGVKSMFSGRGGTQESGQPLLKVAARELLYPALGDRAPNYVKEAMISSFLTEIDKIANMAPPAVPSGMLAPKATGSSPFAIKGAMTPKKTIAKAVARKGAKPGLLSRAAKAVVKVVR